MYCPQCGLKLFDNAKFCGECGHPINPSSPVKETTSNNNDTHNHSSTENPIRYKYVDGKIFNKKGGIVDPDQLVFSNGRQKYPWLAAFLSIIWGGLGTVYLGQYKIGIILMILDFILIYSTFGFSHIIMLIVIPIINYRDAKIFNSGQPIHRWGSKTEPVTIE